MSAVPVEAAADDPPEGEGDGKAENDPQPEQLVDHAHDAVLQQVRREPLAFGRSDRLEQPADVGVPAFGLPPKKL